MHVSATLPAPLTQIPSTPPLSYTSGHGTHELWRGDRATAQEPGIGFRGHLTAITSTNQRTHIPEALNDKLEGAAAMVGTLLTRQAEVIDH